MGSPVRFRRGAPPQNSRSDRVRAEPVEGPESRQLPFARDLPVRFVRCDSERTGCRGHSEPSLAVIGDQAHDVTHKAYLAMALPPVLVNKPIAGCFGQRFAPLDCCQLLLVSALVAIPLVATGGIGTCAAIAAVLVASADKP